MKTASEVRAIRAMTDDNQAEFATRLGVARVDRFAVASWERYGIVNDRIESLMDDLVKAGESGSGGRRRRKDLD